MFDLLGQHEAQSDPGLVSLFSLLEGSGQPSNGTALAIISSHFCEGHEQMYFMSSIIIFNMKYIYYAPDASRIKNSCALSVVRNSRKNKFYFCWKLQ